jgi:hypothetical protein
MDSAIRTGFRYLFVMWRFRVESVPRAQGTVASPCRDSECLDPNNPAR